VGDSRSGVYLLWSPVYADRARDWRLREAGDEGLIGESGRSMISFAYHPGSKVAPWGGYGSNTWRQRAGHRRAGGARSPTRRNFAPGLINLSTFSTIRIWCGSLKMSSTAGSNPLMRHGRADLALGGRTANGSGLHRYNMVYVLGMVSVSVRNRWRSLWGGHVSCCRRDPGETTAAPIKREWFR
jgi:hypothetical protein